MRDTIISYEYKCNICGKVVNDDDLFLNNSAELSKIPEKENADIHICYDCVVELRVLLCGEG